MEYWNERAFAALWARIDEAAARGVAQAGGDSLGWLEQLSPAWRLVGRVTFHLAENPRSTTHPFAFLATFTTRLSDEQQPQHLPLGKAVRECSARQDQGGLQALLEPVQRAAAEDPFVRALVESGKIYQPQAWLPEDAFAFLQAIPAIQDAGIVVKVPDWWERRRPGRPKVEVEVQAPKAGAVGMGAMLSFRVKLALGGEELSADEWERLLAAGAGLVSLRGKWVEVDGPRLGEALAHWRKVEAAAAEGRIGFVEGMRWIAGFRGRAAEMDAPESGQEWVEVRPDARLETWLAEFQESHEAPQVVPGDGLRAQLRSYQAIGLNWLHRLQDAGLGACLADDMGLGKTLQIIALLVTLQRPGRCSLVVAPASLLGNWMAEFARFAPDLRVACLHRSSMTVGEMDRLERELRDCDVVLTTYAMLSRLEWLATAHWDLLILDEAQAIKNPTSRQTLAAKRLQARCRIAMTGTPVENGIDDLWSIFDFLNPGLLGTLERFREGLQRMGPTGYQSLRRLLGPFLLRRLKTDPAVAGDLPPKIELRVDCLLTKGQAVLYENEVRQLAAWLSAPDPAAGDRKAVVLQTLLRLKRICDHPALLSGSGNFDPAVSGKFMRLRTLAGEICARGEKLIVFTQFREMTGAVGGLLEQVFRRPGLVLHGGTPVARRAELVERFQEPLGPPFFVISLRAGGTGLNLTAASHVIHLDRWWNPAVENQATDRAYRIGQTRTVLVHKFVCPGTIEERIDAMLGEKLRVADQIVGPADVSADWMELDDGRLLAFLAYDGSGLSE
jgi:non-specific serine/threonine protein kinase